MLAAHTLTYCAEVHFLLHRHTYHFVIIEAAQSRPNIKNTRLILTAADRNSPERTNKKNQSHGFQLHYFVSVCGLCLYIHTYIDTVTFKWHPTWNVVLSWKGSIKSINNQHKIIGVTLVANNKTTRWISSRFHVYKC